MLYHCEKSTSTNDFVVTASHQVEMWFEATTYWTKTSFNSEKLDMVLKLELVKTEIVFVRLE